MEGTRVKYGMSHRVRPCCLDTETATSDPGDSSAFRLSVVSGDGSAMADESPMLNAELRDNRPRGGVSHKGRFLQLNTELAKPSPWGCEFQDVGSGMSLENCPLNCGRRIRR